MLGTAWKYNAGSPDHDDFIELEEHINKITLNNNKQVIINNQLEQRLNSLTKITYSITNTIK